jgi:hypothetical protein
VCTIRFWNNLHQVRSKSNDLKVNISSFYRYIIEIYIIYLYVLAWVVLYIYNEKKNTSCCNSCTTCINNDLRGCDSFSVNIEWINQQNKEQLVINIVVIQTLLPSISFFCLAYGSSYVTRICMLDNWQRARTINDYIFL